MTKNQPSPKKKVLSIQSHVVHGYVGNKSAVLPLQLLGFDVSPINSVQFSNHTGYNNGFKGKVLNGQELADLVTGLTSNNLLKNYDYLLTGYIGSESFLEAVLSVYAALKKKNPNVVFFCDPVLGDNGKLYVPEELISIYKDKVLALADVITPNEFEFGKLSDIEVKNESDVFKGFGRLHAKGVKKIFLTSTSFGEKLMYASIRSSNGYRVFTASFPYFDCHFTGVGDLFSALLLGWTSILGDNTELAMKHSLSSMQKVLLKTIDNKKKSPDEDQTEIDLISSIPDIMTPPENKNICTDQLKETQTA